MTKHDLRKKEAALHAQLARVRAELEAVQVELLREYQLERQRKSLSANVEYGDRRWRG